VTSALQSGDAGVAGGGAAPPGPAVGV